MNPVAIDIKDILVEAGAGVFAAKNGWSIHVDNEPDGDNVPDTVVSIWNTISSEGKVIGVNNPTFDSYFQVRVRGLDYLKAYEKVKECRTALDRKTNFRKGDMFYAGISTQDGEPLPLPQDKKGRFIFVQNFKAVRQ